MTLLPASTNPHYTGAPAAAVFLAVVGLLTLGPGLIHYLLPDGGAQTIAGLDLHTGSAVIVGTFAWMGATQIGFGAAQLIVAWRYRSLVPLFLVLALVQQALAALAGWITKASPEGHHPPEHYSALALLPLIAIFLRASLRRRA